MKITVLGSGSAFSSPGRFNSCYLVETGESKFLIDCGSDAMRALQKANVDLFSLQEIFITHMHADHCCGLPAVLTAMHVLGRTQPLRVHVPFSQLEFTETWLANLFIYNGRMSFGISLLPLKSGRSKSQLGAELEFVETGHLKKYQDFAESWGIKPTSFSVIVREGKRKFLFSGDLDSLDEVSVHLRDSVSFVEATHPALSEIAGLAQRSNPTIYFTHIPQELESGGEWRNDLRERFGTEDLNIVQDGQVLII